ncbi:tyrosine-type recombinase/integrase [Streptosporangium sp. NPDC051022]|uniref:tyrosine-type recombinase/integrase n=1 Tax=Streptosporangium sp. NPDC051022 TaxID=3155752 RepID=UPI0034353EDA
MRNTNFNRHVWARALQDADLPKIHFHDRRHTGNTLAAKTEASIRELMERIGHSSTRAAMIYQHSTDERQREVARKLDGLARGALKEGSGTRRARRYSRRDGLRHCAAPPRMGTACRRRSGTTPGMLDSTGGRHCPVPHEGMPTRKPAAQKIGLGSFQIVQCRSEGMSGPS